MTRLAYALLRWSTRFGWDWTYRLKWRLWHRLYGAHVCLWKQSDA